MGCQEERSQIKVRFIPPDKTERFGKNFTSTIIAVFQALGRLGYSQKNSAGVCGPHHYPTEGQNLRFSVPCLLLDQKFDTLFMTAVADKLALSIIFEEFLFMVLSMMTKK